MGRVFQLPSRRILSKAGTTEAIQLLAMWNFVGNCAPKCWHLGGKMWRDYFRSKQEGDRFGKTNPLWQQWLEETCDKCDVNQQNHGLTTGYSKSLWTHFGIRMNATIKFWVDFGGAFVHINCWHLMFNHHYRKALQRKWFLAIMLPLAYCWPRQHMLFWTTKRSGTICSSTSKQRTCTDWIWTWLKLWQNLTPHPKLIDGCSTLTIFTVPLIPLHSSPCNHGQCSDKDSYPKVVLILMWLSSRNHRVFQFVSRDISHNLQTFYCLGSVSFAPCLICPAYVMHFSHSLVVRSLVIPLSLALEPPIVFRSFFLFQLTLQCHELMPSQFPLQLDHPTCHVWGNNDRGST